MFGASLKAGLGRVGTSLGERMRWIQDFAVRSLRRDRVEDVEAARWEVLSFLFVPHSGLQPAPVQDVPKDLFWFVGEAHGRHPLLVEREALPALNGMQQHAKKVIEDLRTKGCCNPGVRVDWLGWDRGRLMIESRTGHRARFRHAVMSTLLLAGDRLCVCRNERCRRLFVKTGRRTFCTLKCGNRARARRFARKNPERVSALKHESYAKRVRARAGRQKVKVGRRPRHGALTEKHQNE